MNRKEKKAKTSETQTSVAVTRQKRGEGVVKGKEGPIHGDNRRFDFECGHECSISDGVE